MLLDHRQMIDHFLDASTLAEHDLSLLRKNFSKNSICHFHGAQAYT